MILVYFFKSQYLWKFVFYILFIMGILIAISWIFSPWLKKHILSRNPLDRFMSQVIVIATYMTIAIISIVNSHLILEGFFGINTFDPSNHFWITIQNIFTTYENDKGWTFYIIQLIVNLLTLLLYYINLKIMEGIFSVRNDNLNINDTKINISVFKHMTFLVAYTAVVCLGLQFINDTEYIYIEDKDTLYKSVEIQYYGIEFYEIVSQDEIEEFKDILKGRVEDPQKSLFWISMIILIPYINLTYKLTK